ncbi:MAG TPA: GT4 family glycosyltransferase PelF, partial [Candidatus Binatia bacterium]|nr:GT4 family glycosyltransferase PelF [Candidatus Binatia bacterium]
MKPFDVQNGTPRENSPGGRRCADVCLVLEGTYPYVKGGVSTWVHDLIEGLPDLRFALVHVGPERGTYARMVYSLPANVVSLSNLYCREPPARRPRHADDGRSSRVLRGIRRLHLDDEIDSSLLDDLASGDLSPGAFLHGRASFQLTTDLCQRLAPDASFIDFFWHSRSMHLPLVRLLAAEPPPATVYHSLCTGYAGLLAAVWGHRAGRPFLLTEHGIYARERTVELDRAPWLRGTRDSRAPDGTQEMVEGATALALRRMWARFFRALARCAYARASTVVSICDTNRTRQIADGAPADKTLVVPNGIDPDGLGGRRHGTLPRTPGRHPVRVAFVGRLVPIKDVVTFIHACFLALRDVELDVRIIGPMDEDP